MICEELEKLTNNDFSFIIPSKEEMNKLEEKIKYNKELDFSDYLTLQKMTFCRLILNKYKKESKKNE